MRERLNKILKTQFTILLQGLVIIVPIIITAYVCFKFISWVDTPAQKGLQLLKLRRIPGLGVAIVVIVIYLTGLLARTWIFRKLLLLGEVVIEQIPLVKTLYSGIKDLLQFLSGADAKTRGIPARLKLLDGKINMLVLITQKQPETYLGDAGRGRVAVYVPMSYQLGGYTLYVNADDVEELKDMKVADLVRLSMTAGVGTSPRPELQLSATSETGAQPGQ